MRITFFYVIGAIAYTNSDFSTWSTKLVDCFSIKTCRFTLI